VAEGAPHGVEEDEVSGLQVALVDGLGGSRLLVGAFPEKECFLEDAPIRSASASKAR
jgi:hypothetical protein